MEFFRYLRKREFCADVNEISSGLIRKICDHIENYLRDKPEGLKHQSLSFAQENFTHRHIIYEAPFYADKHIGYLIPIIFTQRRAVIITSSKVQQAEIVNSFKFIVAEFDKFLKTQFNHKEKFTAPSIEVLKGRSNYISPLKVNFLVTKNPKQSKYKDLNRHYRVEHGIKDNQRVIRLYQLKSRGEESFLACFSFAEIEKLITHLNSCRKPTDFEMEKLELDFTSTSSSEAEIKAKFTYLFNNSDEYYLNGFDDDPDNPYVKQLENCCHADVVVLNQTLFCYLGKAKNNILINNRDLIVIDEAHRFPEALINADKDTYEENKILEAINHVICSEDLLSKVNEFYNQIKLVHICQALNDNPDLVKQISQAIEERKFSAEADNLINSTPSDNSAQSSCYESSLGEFFSDNPGEFIPGPLTNNPQSLQGLIKLMGEFGKYTQSLS